VSHLVAERRVEYGFVEKVNEFAKVIEAFQKIIQKGVSGVAVVDSTGVLVGNISTNDMRVIHAPLLRLRA
jgi:hypothetical protein